MRNCILFILILAASNVAHACWYYPDGEAIRVSMFDARIFGYGDFASFIYSSEAFYEYEDELNVVQPGPEIYEPNINLWFNYCRGKVSKEAINAAIYELDTSDIQAKSENQMVKYLYRKNDKDALNYLRFAKSIEYLNSRASDPWEKSGTMYLKNGKVKIKEALEHAKQVANPELKRRYGFLAIRLAYYNGEPGKIEEIFNATFTAGSPRDIIYYWSLYFKAIVEDDAALANFEIAQVFANAPDKRFACNQHFKSKVSLNEMLAFAQSDKEQANVCLLSAIKRYDKTLPYLQSMYAADPTSEGLTFLVLREVNKIEDFVLTPYYTMFEPSVMKDDIPEKWSSVQRVLDRAEGDRLYAKEVLNFVNNANLEQVENPVAWKSCKAYLLFLTKDYDDCLSEIAQLEKSKLNPEIRNQLRRIKALAQTAKQTKGHAVIPALAKSLMLENPEDARFIFAIGKELEYRGNTTDAALLYSTVSNAWLDPQSDYPVNELYWKAIKNRRESYDEYFSDYYDYMDVVYTPEQTAALINRINSAGKKSDTFSTWLYHAVTDKVPQLYDLLGTKYIRLNKLEEALKPFELAGDEYWNRAYTGWEDEGRTFDEHPFYSLKYTPQFIETKDTVRFTKYGITKKLIEYIKRTEDIHEPDRD